MFPFFIIHELSHIIVAILTFKNFEIKEFEFFKITDNNIVIYGLVMDVYGEIDFSMALGSIIPNIVYFIMLICSFCILMSNVTWITIIIFCYVTFSIDVATCSKADYDVFFKYCRDKKII